MNIIIIAFTFVVFGLLAHGFFYYKNKSSKLLNAVFAADQLKQDLILRDKNRSKEFDFVVAQTIGLVSNISGQLYSGGVTVVGFKLEHRAAVGYISDVLLKTPPSFFSHKIGNADAIEDGVVNKNLQELISQAPGLTQLHYIELILVIRYMILNKLDLKSAVNQINSQQ